MYQPLADLLRPTTLDDVFGQEHILGEGAILRRLIDSGNVPKLWLVFSNLMSASPAAKAHNPNTDNIVAKINFFIILMFIGLWVQIYNKFNL